MSTAFYPTSASFKPQVLSRQEGFHLPSPTPSTPTSTDGNLSNNRNANNSSPISPNAFDTHNLFISPPSYLSVPETFRKFPSSDNVHGPSMDFSEELASLIAHPHPSSHERSTQSPANAYDDYRTSTHNIFDISAPTSHHHHPHSPHSPYPSGQSAFSLPPTSALTHHSLHSPSTSLHTPTHSLHEFTTHAHFNSTVPAIGSSMRYEPQPHTTHNQNGSAHPFALNTSSSNNNAGGEPSSVNSFTSHMSSLSAYSNLSSATNGPNDFSHLHQTRQTPSPVLPPPTPISTTSRNDNFSRSRSRSRSSVSTQPINPANPPSTNGGPTRRTRPKRGSVSSVSPPPLHRGHITQPLVIPGSANAGPGSARSPLSLHTSGWFGMGPSGTAGSLGNGNMGVAGGMGGEFSLPTPESVHGGFASFGSASILSGSPKDLNMNGMLSGAMSVNGAKGDSPPADMAAKQ
ncbi:hypothetical protein PHLCEN_2v9837 [Hermanssonia centrifuga]|uniref:Uncharacterized protein n=1 Tax=Hermanssonia centrifuga TaxID=98765 RepID=A0A2R6NPR5_9APHY|nr:hypothetical protein PHLCEN_2v9837 [Hermanssonia centrifuga]